MFGVSVAFSQLVYHALIVTDCPDSILEALAVNVHVAPPVFTAGHSSPVQSSLQCQGVPLSSPSSQTSFGFKDRSCRALNPLTVSIPPFPSLDHVVLSITPSPHLAT